MNDFVMLAVKPAIKALIKIEAAKKGQFAYQWIAEAVQEKIEREKQDEQNKTN